MPLDEGALGATLVNDELETGANVGFERRWHFYAMFGRCILALVIAACLAGLLGSGPFSHRSVSAPSGMAAVDFEPIARFGTPTQITLHIRPPDGIDVASTAELHLDSNFVEPMGLQGNLPASVMERAEGGGVVLAVELAPKQEALIRLQARPSQMGPIPLAVRVNDGPPTRWTQFILP